MNNDIKNISTYIAKEQKTESLLDDWRILTAWWSAKKQGNGGPSYSMEQILNLAIQVVKELQNRDIQFHPETMKPNAKDLFDRVIKIIETSSFTDRNVAPVYSTRPDDGTTSKITSSALVTYWSQPIMLIEEFVTLVGGVCNAEEGTSGDLDLLLRKSPPTGDEDLALLFRLYRALPEDLRDRLHIVYDIFHGPFTPHHHVYDLWLVPSASQADLHLMSSKIDAERSKKQDRIEPFRYFYMLKPMHGRFKEELYSIDSVIEVVNSRKEDWYTTGIFVEVKFDGVHCQAHCDADHIQIFTEQGTDVTKKLPSLVNDLQKINNGPTILAGELEYWQDKKHQSRQEAAAIIHSTGISSKESNVIFNPFDILYGNDRDIHREPYTTRLVLLENLPFTDMPHVRKVPYTLVHNEVNLRKAIKQAADTPGSEGAYLKLATFQYELDGSTLENIKYKSTASMDVEVLSVHHVAGSQAYNYLCIIRTPDGKPVPIGNTYNTSIVAREGDILKVEFVNLNKYTDPDTQQIWYNFWAPRVILKRTDRTQPDTSDLANELVKATHGEEKIAPWPSRYAILKDSIDLDTEKSALFLDPAFHYTTPDTSAYMVLSTGDLLDLSEFKEPEGGIDWIAVAQMLKSLRVKIVYSAIPSEIPSTRFTPPPVAPSITPSPTSLQPPSPLSFPAPVSTALGSKEIIIYEARATDLPRVYYSIPYFNPFIGWSKDRLKSLSLQQQKEIEAETHLIQKNQQTPEAQKPHAFMAAQWTHPNGHPRCLLCGDEPRIPREGETPDNDGYGKCDGLSQHDTRHHAEDADLTVPTVLNMVNALDHIDIQPFLTLPDESKTWKAVVHAHVRGKSVHLDFRAQIDKDLLIGWTIAMPAGLSTTPTSFTEAQSLVNSEIIPIIKDTFADPVKKFLTIPKEPEPIQWLTFEGAVKPGEVGATRFEEGFFIIVDQFEVEFLTQKSHFHEYWCHGKLFDRRLVIRLIENRKQWKRTDEGLMTWMIFHPDDDPYVISRRAMSIKWIPPQGHSALPRWIRQQVPKEHQYWMHKSEKDRLLHRDMLVDEKWMPQPVLADFEEDQELTTTFKLQLQTWRGQHVVRWGPSRTEYHLLISSHFDLVHPDDLLNDQPGPMTQTTVYLSPFSIKRWEAIGDIEPQTTLNSSKNTPSFIEVKDFGDVQILTNTSQIKKFVFKGKKFKGTWLLRRETPSSNIWLFEKIKASPT